MERSGPTSNRHTGPASNPQIPAPPPPPPLPGRDSADAAKERADYMASKATVSRSNSQGSDVFEDAASELPAPPAGQPLRKRKAEVLDASVENVQLKQPLSDEQVLERDNLKAERNRLMQVARDLRANQYIKVQAPAIIKALQDPVFAREHEINIILEVDGVPVHLAPPDPRDGVSPEKLKKYQEFVIRSLAEFSGNVRPLNWFAAAIKENSQELKKVDKELQELGVKVHRDIEKDMLNKSTIVVIDIDRTGRSVVWGEPGDIPESAVGKHRSSIESAPLHFTHKTDEVGRAAPSNSSGWEDFEDEDDEDDENAPFAGDLLYDSPPIPPKAPPEYQAPPDYPHQRPPSGANEPDTDV